MSEFHTISILVAADIQTKSDTQRTHISMMYCHTKFPVHNSTGISVIALKPTAKYNSCTATVLLLDIIQKNITLRNITLSSMISYHIQFQGAKISDASVPFTSQVCMPVTLLLLTTNLKSI